MTRTLWIQATVILALAISANQALPQAATATAPDKSMVSSYGKLPLAFEANQGQTDARVKFLSHGKGYALFLTGDAAVLTLEKPRQHADRGEKIGGPQLMAGDARPDSVLRMKLVGANPQANVMGAEELDSKSNYFLGNDPAKWRANVPNYAQVKYQNVYPGVDLVYYGSQSGQLEYDFVVAPGADPGVIALDFATDLSRHLHSSGSSPSVRIGANGDLVLKTDGGEMRFKKPVLYQPAMDRTNGNSGSGSRTAVEGRYILKANHQVGFQIASYDRTRPLYIDPVLIYSTYLGGTGDDYGQTITVDAAGNAYVVGRTTSTDFPVTAGAYLTDCAICITNPSPLYIAFISKLNPAGNALLYSTYLGSSSQGDTWGNGIAVDSSGNAYVAGYTGSSSFPTTTGAFQTANPSEESAAFVTKLNPAGSALVYSTYLDAGNTVWGNAIAIDSTGDAYITGYTQAGDFPTLHPVQASFGGTVGTSDNVFVTALNPTGTALIYSTYLGGSFFDQGNGIVVDNSGNVYVEGYTSSSDFPLLNSYQPSLLGSSAAFVAKMHWNGTTLALVYSTLLGGSSSAQGTGLAVDPSGNVYLTGWTGSSDFPITASAPQANYAGGGDAFLTKLVWNGSALSLGYSTFLGGSGEDQANAIAIDSSGDAYVVGTTLSTNFPTVNAIQSTSGGGYYAFVTELNSTGSNFVYSTYLGGADPAGYGTSGYGIALDSASNAYVTGNTGATNFPTTASPLQSTCGGCSSYRVTAFVSKLPVSTIAPSVSLSGNLTYSAQNVHTTSASQTETVTNNGTADLAISTVAFGGTDPGDFANVADTCTGATVIPAGTCTVMVTFTPSAAGSRSASLNFTDNATGSPQGVTLTGTGTTVPTPTINWTLTSPITYGTALGSGDFNATVTYSSTNVSTDGTFAYTIGTVGGTAATTSTILPGGSNQLCVQWTPLSSYASQYTSTSECLPIQVNAASTSISWTPSSTTIIAATGPTSGQLDASALAGETNVTSDGTLTYHLSTVGGTTITTGTALTPGPVTIYAVWTPTNSADYTGSFTSVSFTVINTQPTTTVVTSNTNPIFYTNSVTFTATVTPTSGTIVPTGTVTFYDNGAQIGTGSLSASGTGASAIARFTTASLAIGTHPITASYGGDTNNQASPISTALPEVVEDFSIAANTPTSNTIEPGTSTTFTFTVSPVSPATTFPAAITLTAANLPAGATYTLSPASINSGAGSTSVTLTVTTPITTLARNAPPGRAPAPKWPLIAVALLLLPMAGKLRRAGRGLSRMLSLLLLVAAGLSAAAALSGCGGVPTGYFGQAPATSSITVTGTSGSLNHNASVSLTVE